MLGRCGAGNTCSKGTEAVNNRPEGTDVCTGVGLWGLCFPQRRSGEENPIELANNGRMGQSALGTRRVRACQGKRLTLGMEIS